MLQRVALLSTAVHILKWQGMGVTVCEDTHVASSKLKS